METVEILVYPGDGKHLTEAEVRNAAKTSPKGVATASEADRKKADAEYQKQLAKYNEEKAKAENSNKVVNAALKDGGRRLQSERLCDGNSKIRRGRRRRSRVRRQCSDLVELQRRYA
jgi:hypothetical protein